jgi:hypothetical protein
MPPFAASRVLFIIIIIIIIIPFMQGIHTCIPETNHVSRVYSVAAIQRLAVTLRTTKFNIKKFYVVPTLRLCVLYGSQNKQQLLHYKTLRDWFL